MQTLVHTAQGELKASRIKVAGGFWQHKDGHWIREGYLNEPDAAGRCPHGRIIEIGAVCVETPGGTKDCFHCDRRAVRVIDG